MRCPHCDQMLIQKQPDAAQIRIKGKVLLKADGAHAQCFWCGADVVVPLKLTEPPIKPGTRLVLRKPEKTSETLDKDSSIG